MRGCGIKDAFGNPDTPSPLPSPSGRGSEDNPLSSRPALCAIRRTAIVYVALLALSTLAWWAWMLAIPAHRELFWPRVWPVQSFLIFLPADVLMIVGTCIAFLVLQLKQSPLARPMLWSVAGVMGYSSILCIGAAAFTGQATAAATFMAAGFLGMVALAFAEVYADRESMLAGFRLARSRSPRMHLLTTILQLLVFWPTILFLFPIMVDRLGDAMGLPGFESTMSHIAGVVMFLVAATFNLWAAFVMSGQGDGTPFPYDATRRLVIAGPYRVIRNPMAVTGLTQGMAVAIYLGSPLVIAYVLCGASIWQWLIRPIEEQMLLEQFGKSFADYRASVRCWWPTLAPVRSKTVENVQSTAEGFA